jgi:hypothetical protein
MVRRRSALLQIVMLAMCGMLLLAVAANSATDARYRGTTSQDEPISLRLSGHYVKRLDYQILDRCPGGRRLLNHDFNFPRLRIRHSRFGGRFVAHGGVAIAIVKGRVSQRTVRGSLTDQARTKKTRKFCRGRATFTLDAPKFR